MSCKSILEAIYKMAEAIYKMAEAIYKMTEAIFKKIKHRRSRGASRLQALGLDWVMESNVFNSANAVGRLLET